VEAVIELLGGLPERGADVGPAGETSTRSAC
jgi:hypothetical protein